MEFYRLRDVIIGLRDEYKKNEQRLEALKQYIDIKEDANITEFEFYSYVNDDNKYVEMVLQAKQNFIVEVLNKIKKSLGKKSEMKSIPLSRGYNNDYTYLLAPEEQYYTIDESKSCDLYYEADKILNSPFVSKVAHGRIVLPDQLFDITISPSGIIAHNDSHDCALPPAGFIYSAKGDQLIITAYEDYLYNEHINNILNIKIPAVRFNDDIRNIIEGNPKLRKDIIVEGAEMTKASQLFKVEDINSSTIGLVRKRKR